MDLCCLGSLGRLHVLLKLLAYSPPGLVRLLVEVQI